MNVYHVEAIWRDGTYAWAVVAAENEETAKIVLQKQIAIDLPNRTHDPVMEITYVVENNPDVLKAEVLRFNIR